MKHFLLLGIIVAVLSSTASGYIEGSGTYIDSEYLKGSWDFKYEWAYSSIYSAEVVDDYWIKDAYGVRMWANLTTYAEFEILGAYTIGIENIFTLFDFTPLKFAISYIKYEFVQTGEVDHFDAAFEALYTTKAFELETNIY